LEGNNGMRKYFGIAITLLMLAPPAFAAMPTAVKQAETAKGQAFVDTNGMTLYVFDKDSSGKSACNGPCATNWPPLAAGSGSMAEGDWSIVHRDDGNLQWAYKGHPLYTFIQDKQAGDIKGDGFLNNSWHIAKP
jgi:predicted lipoprotein with Yx(FWY)xxD motif